MSASAWTDETAGSTPQRTLGAGAAVIVEDQLSSTSGTHALSANQGRLLSESIAALSARLDVEVDERAAFIAQCIF